MIKTRIGWQTVILLGLALVIAAVAWFGIAVPVHAQASNDTSAQIPVGEGIAAIATVVVGVGTFLANRILGPLAMTFRVDQLLANAVWAGLETVGYRPGMVLTVDVKSRAIAEAVRYAIDHAARPLIRFVGGTEFFERMIRPRLERAIQTGNAR